jgi:hypothetical protein
VPSAHELLPTRRGAKHEGVERDRPQQISCAPASPSNQLVNHNLALVECAETKFARAADGLLLPFGPLVRKKNSE